MRGMIDNPGQVVFIDNGLCGRVVLPSMARKDLSVSGLVLSMALFVVGFWFMGWGSQALGPGLALCGGFGLVLSFLVPYESKPAARAELDHLLQRGILEPEEHARKIAQLEAA